jgi:drug/metabolite transporter (DMT)-like permease
MAATRTPIVVPTHADWLFLLVLIGVFGFLAQLLLTMGLQLETVGRGSMAIYTQIVFASIFERVFFQTYPTFYSAIGIILIVGSALYTAVSKPKAKEGEETGAIRLPDDDIEEGLLAVPVAEAT